MLLQALCGGPPHSAGVVRAPLPPTIGSITVARLRRPWPPGAVLCRGASGPAAPRARCGVVGLPVGPLALAKTELDGSEPLPRSTLEADICTEPPPLRVSVTPTGSCGATAGGPPVGLGGQGSSRGVRGCGRKPPASATGNVAAKAGDEWDRRACCGWGPPELLDCGLPTRAKLLACSGGECWPCKAARCSSEAGEATGDAKAGLSDSRRASGG